MAKSTSSRSSLAKKPAASKASAKTPGKSKTRVVSRPAPSPAPQQSKTSTCLALLQRGDGASLQDLMSATGWQAHSVRGFLSGTVRKKMGLSLSLAEGDAGIRRYRIVAAGE